jgi:uncharacterized membrane protein
MVTYINVELDGPLEAMFEEVRDSLLAQNNREAFRQMLIRFHEQNIGVKKNE